MGYFHHLSLVFCRHHNLAYQVAMLEIFTLVVAVQESLFDGYPTAEFRVLRCIASPIANSQYFWNAGSFCCSAFRLALVMTFMSATMSGLGILSSLAARACDR